jgi:hypothetical protein
MARYLNEQEQKDWDAVSDAAYAAERVLSSLVTTILTRLPMEDAVLMLSVVQAAEDLLRGLGYQCKPQSEWTGTDPKSKEAFFKVRAPHIAQK